MTENPNHTSVKHTLVGVSLLFGAIAIAPSANAYKKIPPGKSLLVMNKPHTDAAKFRERLKKHGLVIINEVHCKADAFMVFEVQPQSESVKTALQRVISSGDTDLEGAEVKMGAKFNQCTPAINDPSYGVQPNLQQIKYSELFCLLDAMNITQAVQPRFTIIDTGMSPVTAGNEMVDLQQFNFTGGVNGVAETPTQSQFSFVHGTGVASIASAASNNGAFIAGVASYDKPVKITSLRVSNDGSTVDTLDVIAAMTWCLDNHTTRGGAGVINMSLDAIPPIPSYNASPVFQAIAKSGIKLKDLFVNSAGNNGLEDPSKEKYIRRVASVESDDTLSSFSNFGKFKAAAPGHLVAAIDQTDYTVQFASGTSFAAPHWSGGVALLMSLKPTLDAVAADKLLEKTGRKTAQKFVVPDLRAAVIKALKLKP